MKFHFTTYPIFLLGTIFASHMCQMSDAIYIDGMLRLFRGEGNYNDDINGYNGSLEGTGHSFRTVTLPTAGAQPRQVFHFGASGRVQGSATGLPSGAAPRTITGWLKMDVPSTTNGPFGYGNPSCNNAYKIWISGGVTLNIDQWCQTEGVNPVINPIVQNTWYHVAFSYDGTYNRAYVNGALVGTGVPDARPNTMLTRVTIGGNVNTGDTQTFRGYVADFAIFNRAITDAEVASIYNAPEGLTATSGLGGSCTSDTNCESGLTCDSTTSTCKVAIGNTCSVASDCSSGFCAGSPLTCTDGSIGSACASGSDCGSNYCDSTTSTCKVAIGNTCSAASDCSSGFCAGSPLTCTDGSIGSACASGSDCSSPNFCAANVCTDGAIGSACASGSDCGSSYCVSNVCTDGAIGSACASGSDCSTGYCSPTSSTCATVPILDPCHGITCSNHGKCKGNGICHCENTFIQTNDGKDCACPDGSFLDASANRCYAPTASPTSSPTSLPVTSSPTLLITSAPTGSPTNTFETPVCENDSSYKFKLKRVEKEVDCLWISKNKKRKEKRRAKYCTEEFDNGALVAACKKSCDLCTV